MVPTVLPLSLLLHVCALEFELIFQRSASVVCLLHAIRALAMMILTSTIAKFKSNSLSRYDRAKKVQTYTKEDARRLKMNEG